MVTRFRSSIAAPFRAAGGQVNRALVALFLLINAIVALNAIIHHPMIGYDGVGHLRYVGALAEGRIPTHEDTKEFFTPPLPFVVPALAYAIIREPCTAAGVGSEWDISSIPPCLVVAGKVGQAQNVVVSLVLTFTLLKLSELLVPGSAIFKSSALALVGSLPVYYKTFAFVRSEPLLVALVLIALYQVLAMLMGAKRCTLLNTVILGVVLGFVVLSRQWGFFLLPGVALVPLLLALKEGRRALPLAGAVAASFVIAALVGGWFYVLNQVRYGTVAAFNRQADEHFSFANQPPEFYVGTGGEALFREPIRPAFPNQLFPTFYSDTWGDYWCYFSVTGCGSRRGFDESISNLEQMKGYLGRVNLVSLAPTALLGAGFLVGMVLVIKSFLPLTRFFQRGSSAPAAQEAAQKTHQHNHHTTIAFAALQVVVVVSLLGYGWFLISFPSLGKGDTIKASYMLQVFPLLALLASVLVERLHRLHRAFSAAVLLLLGAVFLHTLPAMVSRYTIFVG